jgi:hypothetical protein
MYSSIYEHVTIYILCAWIFQYIAIHLDIYVFMYIIKMLIYLCEKATLFFPKPYFQFGCRFQGVGALQPMISFHFHHLHDGVNIFFTSHTLINNDSEIFLFMLQNKPDEHRPNQYEALERTKSAHTTYLITEWSQIVKHFDAQRWSFVGFQEVQMNVQRYCNIDPFITFSMQM